MPGVWPFRRCSECQVVRHAAEFVKSWPLRPGRRNQLYECPGCDIQKPLVAFAIVEGPATVLPIGRSPYRRWPRMTP